MHLGLKKRKNWIRESCFASQAKTTLTHFGVFFWVSISAASPAKKLYLREYPGEDDLPVGGAEEDSPVQPEHVHQLQPREVLVLHVPNQTNTILDRFLPIFYLSGIFFIF